MRIEAGRFTVTLAETEADVAAAQRLRYRVFVEEMGATPTPEDAEIQAFENPGDLLTALQANQVDAVLQDLPVNAEFARNNDGFEVVETYDTGEQYGFAVAEEGSDNLLAAVNEALQAVRDAGTYDELYDKYFSAE